MSNNTSSSTNGDNSMVNHILVQKSKSLFVGGRKPKSTYRNKVFKKTSIEDYENTDNLMIYYFYNECVSSSTTVKIVNDSDRKITHSLKRKGDRITVFPSGGVKFIKYLNGDCRIPESIPLTSLGVKKGNFNYEQAIHGGKMAQFLKDLTRFERILNDNLYTFNCAIRQFKLELGTIDVDLFIGFLCTMMKLSY